MTHSMHRPIPVAMSPEVDIFLEGLLHRELPLLPAEAFANAWVPNVDLSETDTEYIVRLEVPGIRSENLDVTLDGNVLTLSGQREARQDKTNEKYIWRERDQGRFVRALRLPGPVVEQDVKASIHNGLLTVQLPKAEPSIQGRILIE